MTAEEVMAQEETTLVNEGKSNTGHHPSSPTGSNSSREGTKDARERLKKTTIATLSTPSTTQETELVDTNGVRGRPSKKRSFEDLAKGEPDTDAIIQPPEPKSGHHKRMRSRDVSSADHTTFANLDGEIQRPVSETNEENDADARISPGGPAVLVDVPTQEEMDSTKEKTSVKVAPSEKPSFQTERTSAFTNTSSTSPFGSNPTKEKSPELHSTSNSAFASSGLSAFASSGKSPFGAAGTKSPLGGSGGFGGPSSGGFGSTKSGFGSTGFGSASNFGGSTFGQPKSFGTTSTTFATPKPFGTSTFGGGNSTFGTPKPFGSKKEDDDEDEEDDGDEDGSAAKIGEANQDPRFHEQQVETGEDGETAEFTARARLYVFDTAWKERGTGTLKVNIRMENDGEDEEESRTRRKARLLMRMDATHRVILNVPVFKGMQFGASDGSIPTGKLMQFQGLEEGKLVPFQIKIGKEDVLRKLYDLIQELEAEA